MLDSVRTASAQALQKSYVEPADILSKCLVEKYLQRLNNVPNDSLEGGNLHCLTGGFSNLIGQGRLQNYKTFEQPYRRIKEF